MAAVLRAPGAETAGGALDEDAQYADTGLLDFLDSLVDWARDLPVFVLVLARPELGQARPGFGTGRSRTTLTLDPLDAASMESAGRRLGARMPDSPVRGRPARPRDSVVRRGDAIRSLIDRDVVQPSEGVYRLVGEFGHWWCRQPAALLAARLDALEPDVRR